MIIFAKVHIYYTLKIKPTLRYYQLISKHHISLIVVLIVLGSQGCNKTFDPLDSDHPYVFSMNGQLDIHADTSFIRVMPIERTLIPSDTAFTKATVRFKKITEDGFQELPHEHRGLSENVFVRNYYHVDQLEPNSIYHITALNDQDAKSEVIVTLPDILPIPTISYDLTLERGIISGTVAKKDSIVHAETIYTIGVFSVDGCYRDKVHVNELQNIRYGINGYEVLVNNRANIGFSQIPGTTRRVLYRQFVITSANESYPNLRGLTREEATLPINSSNVVNGTGFVAGIARRKMDISPDSSAICPI